MMSPRVLIAAGGTGGHVFPALAVARALADKGWHAEWVGTDRGLESRVVPDAGFALHILRFTGLRGKGITAWLSLPLRLAKAWSDARRIVQRVRPQVVVAFGGYVTFPVGLAARWSGIPLCVHEQNAVMGSANRWLARLSQLVFISFPRTRFAPSKALWVGNPVRQDIAALDDPGPRYAARQDALRILVVGGSLGAQAINRLVPEAVAVARQQGVTLQIRHQTGDRDLESVRATYQRLGIPAECCAFIDDMTSAYAWADLLIGRAGASTVSEVCAVGVAALFIPLPSAIDDHQTANAAFLSQHDAAWLMPQTTLSVSSLGQTLATLDREQLKHRALLAREQRMVNTLAEITHSVTQIATPAREAHR
jgi:UDP-N-acetylglucosamine--N-acetylmuramyl-(pentapeptide) pyrophosphoryl-undecaprenol N-acetylglucosamine transferase